MAKLIDVNGLKAVVQKINADTKDIRTLLEGKAGAIHTHKPEDVVFSDGKTLIEKLAEVQTGGKVDLAGYATEAYVDGKIGEVNTALAGKVDAVEGQRLITQEEAAKLAGLENYDDAELAGRVAALEGINHNDFAKAADLAGKVDKEEGKVLIAQTELDRLAGLHNYDDAALVGRVEVLEAIDHNAFLKADDIAGKADAADLQALAAEVGDPAVEAKAATGLYKYVDDKVATAAVEVATKDELLAMYDEMQLEVPATIDNVATSVAAVNVALNGLKADVYNQPAGTDVNAADVSNMYVAVALPGDEMYAAATKEIKNVPQTVKMSVGNNNFLTFDQYKIEGNELKLSIPTMLLDDDGKFELEAAGYKNADIAVAVPDMQEPEVVVKKHATFNAAEYNIVQVGNEVNIELVSTVSTPSWANSGRLLLLFDFLGADKVSLINADSTFITKKVYSTGGENLGMTGPDSMAAEGEVAKYCLAMYVPVKDVAYDLKYKAILIGSDYKCMNVTIHVPANI